MNGFEFLERCKHISSVIFTTSYDQYAIKAFRISALITCKPIDPEELVAAVHKVEEQSRGRSLSYPGDD
jgi:two-component system LytT family response regulator